MVARVTAPTLAALLCTGAPSAQSQPDLSTRAIVAAASTYAAEYQSKFRFLVADEHYRQAVVDPGGRPTAERVIRGELFLAFLAATDEWIAVHDFAEVDGQPVAGREELRALLQKGEVQPVAARVVNRNAQYNIGTIGRNFNEPTLPLLIFSPKHRGRFAFDRRRVEADAGRTRVILGFRERERPTLIRSTRGRPMHSTGEIVLDAATGRIERTTLELDDAGIRVRLTTVYQPDAKLDMWLPATFTERYEETGGERELILCEAQYSNYRRFEVLGRIR